MNNLMEARVWTGRFLTGYQLLMQHLFITQYGASRYQINRRWITIDVDVLLLSGIRSVGHSRRNTQDLGKVDSKGKASGVLGF
jgi:hypothetical protein